MSLVEVLVGLALLAFVALGSMSLLALSMRQTSTAGHRTVATNLAADRMDKLASHPFRSAAEYLDYQLPEETASAGPPATLTTDYGVISGYPGFRRVVTLDYGVPVTGMLRVETEVSWQELHAGQKTHALITYFHPELEESP